MQNQTYESYIQLESGLENRVAPSHSFDTSAGSYGTIGRFIQVTPLASPSLMPVSKPSIAPPPPSLSLLASIFNLVKVLIGAGMLALPSGMAAGQGTGFAPALMTLIFSAIASAYTFYIIGLSLHATNTTSFKALLVHTHGPKMAWAIDSIIIVLGLVLGLLYADFVGDLFATFLKSFAIIPEWLATRQVVILAITTTVLGPLCLQRDLHGLRHSSYLGVAAVIYITLFMLLRYLDGSYLPGGEYYAEQKDTSESGSNPSTWSFGLGSAVLVSMLTTSFTAHQNAPQFSSQLENFTNFRFGIVVFAAFSLSAILYMLVMFAGFCTFGMHSEGLVLDNFSEKDTLATIARFATGISVLCSAPLVFAAFRESVSNCLQGRIDLNFHSLSIILLALVTGLSLFFSDVGFIVSMIGSLCDGPLMFILPSMVYVKVMEQYPKYRKGSLTKTTNYCLIGFGIFLTVFAPVISVLNTYTTLLQ